MHWNAPVKENWGWGSLKIALCGETIVGVVNLFVTGICQVVKDKYLLIIKQCLNEVTRDVSSHPPCLLQQITFYIQIFV